MEASAAEAASMEAAKARLPSEGIGSRNPAMIEPTEGAGMHARLCVGAKSLMASKTSPMGIGGMIKVPSCRIKAVAIDDGPAMRDVRIVIEFDSPAVVPIVSPAVPTPAEAGK